MNHQEDIKLYIPSKVCVNILQWKMDLISHSSLERNMCSLYRTYVDVDFVRCDNNCDICICVYMCTYIYTYVFYVLIYIYIYMTMYFVKKALNNLFNDLCQRVKTFFPKEGDDCKCTLFLCLMLLLSEFSKMLQANW